MARPANVPAELLEELRALARKHGTLVVVAACADFVRHFAVEGVRAAIAKAAADKEAEEKCPKCRATKALLSETMKSIRRGVPAEGRQPDAQETRI